MKDINKLAEEAFYEKYGKQEGGYWETGTGSNFKKGWLAGYTAANSPSSPVATQVEWDALIDELSNCAICSGYNHRCEDIFDKEKAMGILKNAIDNETR